MKAFLAAYSEGIALAKTNKEFAYRTLRKHLNVDDPRLLEFLHRSSLGKMRPAIPYPLKEALQVEFEFLGQTISDLKGKNSADFVDASLLKELEREGFFSQLKH